MRYDPGMWRSPNGDVVLSGPTRELFCDSLWSMVEGFRYSIDDPISSEVEVFDRLDGGQQIAALHLVGRAALLTDEPPPVLTAVTEGAFAGVFIYYATFLDGELPEEQHDQANARDLALAAAKDRGLWMPAKTKRMVYPDWVELLQELAGTYLWDDDYQDIDAMSDLPPEAARRVRERMTIDDDYYVWIPADYAPQQARAAAEELIELCRQ